MIASRFLEPLHRLPPRPATLDWLWAGASAGLIFGLAELAIAVSAGSTLEPRLAALVLGIDAATVAAASLLVGVALRAGGARISRSGLVGAVLGPLLFAALSGRFWSELAAGGFPAMLPFSGLMTATLLATSAGLAAARLADALEQRGTTCGALYVWGTAALLLAAAERLSDAGWLSGMRGALAGVALVLSVGGAGWLAVELARRRASRSPRAFGWLFSALALAAAGAAAAPIALPWIFYEPYTAPVRIGPPSILIALLPDPLAAGSAAPRREGVMMPHLEQLAADGVVYEIDPARARAGAGALFSDTRGASVVSSVSSIGYATAAFLPTESTPPELAGAEADAQPGARRLLGGPLRWLAAAPLLRDPALPLLRALGLDTDTRAAGQLLSRAIAWLLDWKRSRSDAPFALILDFRRASGHSDDPLGEQIDRGLGDAIEHLITLGVSESTLVMLWIEGGADPARGMRPARVIVRPPRGWPRPAAAQRIAASRLGDFLVEVSRSDGSAPIALPESR